MIRLTIAATLLATLILAPIVLANDESAQQPAGVRFHQPDKAALGLENPETVIFFDDLNTQESFAKNWVESKVESINGKFEWSIGPAPWNLTGDEGLLIPAKARKYAISAKFPNGLVNLANAPEETFTVAYSVRLTNDWTCGGGYIKLLTKGFDQATFDGSTPYSIMFGPDKCGAGGKVHFIFRREHPITKEVTEYHLKDTPTLPDLKPKGTYFFQLSVTGTNFTIYTNGLISKQGEFTKSGTFNPDLFDALEIDDPADKKPPQEEWDEREMIEDPEAVKPEGWDDIPSEIPDPEAPKPADWDDEMDGEWEAPVIPNPDYKGEWFPPLISNPAYKGKWAPRKIANPNFYDFSSNPHKWFLPTDGLGFELWTMDEGMVIDNVFVGVGEKSLQVAKQISINYFEPRLKWEGKVRAEIQAAATPGWSITEFLKLMQQNPLITGLAGVGALLPILLLCFMCTGGDAKNKKQPATKDIKKDLVDNEKEDKKEDAPVKLAPPASLSATTEPGEGLKKRKAKKDN